MNRSIRFGREDFLKLRADVAAATLLMHGLRFLALLQKAGFRPDQPRVPAGDPEGGQWTAELGATGNRSRQDADPRVVRINHDPEKLPDIPKERPPTVRERNRIALAVARFVSEVSTASRLIDVGGWVYEHARDRIVAYLEPAKSLEELQDAVFEPKPGYEIHHIVEQTPARQDGFPDAMINSRENRVLVPTYRHWEVTAWFATRNNQFGGMSPREFLRGERWEVRYAMGLKALREYGVLK